MRNIKRLAASISVAMIAAALLASPAMASVHWSDTTHGIKLEGNLTVSTKGQTSKTCEIVSPQKSAMEPSWAYIWNGTNELLNLKCTGSTGLSMLFLMEPTSTTNVRLPTPGYEFMFGPWGFYCACVYVPTGEFKNGSGGTASTMTFSNDPIGYDNSAEHNPLTISGTYKVTTSTGGLLTLLP